MNGSDESSLVARWMADCTLCPRNCHVNRLLGKRGFCGQDAGIVAARAALHPWEEPCLSGTNGSGTVFFCGCNLQCVFCQNRDIAASKMDGVGKRITSDRLAQIFLELMEKGAHNINLVTPTHLIPQIHDAILIAKSRGLTLPIVYNSGGYESPEALRMLDGLVDIYLPDFKYVSSELSARYSHAADYFPRACAALEEMFRQVGKPVFSPGTGLLLRGMVVRHLLLPGQAKDSKKALRYLHNTYGNDILYSILNQYTPMPQVACLPELARKVTEEEYQRVLQFAIDIGIENGFRQEGEAASESFIPRFDNEGI